MDNHLQSAIEGFVSVPSSIYACAAAVAADLLRGPQWAVIPKEGVDAFTEEDFYDMREDADEAATASGGTVEEVYTGQVGNALNEFISDLPSSLWYEADSGDITDMEPQGHNEEMPNPDWDEEDPDSEEFVDEFVSPGDYSEIDRGTVVEALFGKTIANEFK